MSVDVVVICAPHSVKRLNGSSSISIASLSFLIWCRQIARLMPFLCTNRKEINGLQINLIEINLFLSRVKTDRRFRILDSLSISFFHSLCHPFHLLWWIQRRLYWTDTFHYSINSLWTFLWISKWTGWSFDEMASWARAFTPKFSCTHTHAYVRFSDCAFLWIIKWEETWLSKEITSNKINGHIKCRCIKRTLINFKVRHLSLPVTVCTVQPKELNLQAI